MEENRTAEIIKKTKRKTTLLTVVIMLCAFACVLWMTSFVKYLIAVLLVIIGVFLSVRIQSVSYLLYRDCDPQLYYAVAQGVATQVPVDKQIHTAELLGDYSAAIQLSQTMLQQSKNPYVRLTYLSEIAKNAFYAGDDALCRKSVAEFSAAAQGRKVNEYLQKRNEFYLAYLDGDYRAAKTLLEEAAFLPKRQTNSFRCSMLFCRAITDYALNDITAAKTEFEEVMTRFPKMYFAAASRAYLEGMENNTPAVLPPPAAPMLPASHAAAKVSKKDVLTVVLFLVIILGCIIGVPSAMSLYATADTPLQAIQKYEDTEATAVKYTLPLDEQYSVCIFETKEAPGVAYLKARGEKYECKIAMCHEELLIADDTDVPPSKMHAAGTTTEIVYLWFYDESEVPKEYETVPIPMQDKTIYFCYRLKHPQRYFSNSYGLALTEERTI